ncbi:Protein LAZ1 homolog 1 [Rhizoctonia solani]|uniref:Protein LAZ1 homolog 1 n=1 Tax=Rhizoctonia solani TaxID=456999 RepID=A0A0K6G7T7_9AGAM|nr:Protein LAZ1 homolog 1 [Rhizoctonia solani]
MQCPVDRSRSVPPLASGLEGRDVGYIIASWFTFVSVSVSAWLVQKHLRWYSCEPQQRYIIRLLFMAPIYASIALAAYVSPSNSTPLYLVRDSYEAVTLASFLSLLLEYLPGPRHPEPAHKRYRLDQSLNRVGSSLSKVQRQTVAHKLFYRFPMRGDPQNGHKPLTWIFPLCFIRARTRDGLAYLRAMKWGVWQYCFIRPGSSLAAMILQQLNLYCESSWSWRWGHVYVVTVASVSSVVAVYCLIQLYTTIHQELKPYKPLLKLLSITALVFVTFWQSSVLSGLASLNLIPDTQYLTSDDITIGFPALLQTFEMACLTLLHLKVFSYLPYKRIASAEAQIPPFLVGCPDSGLPAPIRQQILNLFHALRFRLRLAWRPGRGAYDECRHQERLKQDRARSFMRGGGYTGVAQDDDEDGDDDGYYVWGAPRMMFSPLSSLYVREDERRSVSEEAVGHGSEYEYGHGGYGDVPFLQGVSVPVPAPQGTYAPAPLQGVYVPAPTPQGAYAPAPPPQGAYVPMRGPAWSGNGVIAPPTEFRGPPMIPDIPPVSPFEMFAPSNVLNSSSDALISSQPSQLPQPPQPPQPPQSSQTSQPQPQASRRIGSVYVGGTRGQEFMSRTDDLPGSPRLDPTPVLFSTPVAPHPIGTPVSVWSTGPSVSRSGTSPLSPLPESFPQVPSLPQPKGTHISPTSAYMLAQTSPLFQQSFSADVPPSSMSPQLLRVSEDSVPRTSGETQRNSGFTLPRWALGTPTHSRWPSGATHSQWPSGTTHSQLPLSRRTSANTIDPFSPSTQAGRTSMSEEVESPLNPRDSLFIRVLSDTSRTRDSALTSRISSELGVVYPVQSVTMRTAAPALVRLGDRRDSISSPSLVSSNVRAGRESDPSTPSPNSSRPAPSPHTALASPPEVARPLRRIRTSLQLRVPGGPRPNPRIHTLSGPLRPMVARSSVSSVHPTVSQWDPFRPLSTSSSAPPMSSLSDGS